MPRAEFPQHLEQFLLNSALTGPLCMDLASQQRHWHNKIGSKLWDRDLPQSPSHGKVPSSLAPEGKAVPSSSTHQQRPRCIPLEERHCVV
ncbi:hypothetical protein J4Q44_G00216640 [Coregonus suidteri]|uniref:Uncharacterized protein n=1 Tax=Coregonus suidteri TaxID=861788 RepID=A0AAN8LDT4_9TELE